MDIEVIKAKIAEFKAKGCEVPDMDMIKTLRSSRYGYDKNTGTD